MAFCQSCGAQLAGDFCTNCGTRAGAGGPSAAAGAAQPTPVQPVSGVKRKTSPIVWILVAVLGLFMLFGIAVVGGGFLLLHKAKQAGLDPDLMRNNPGLATAKLLAATNPDLEVASTDEGKGLITIRQKSTGKTMTVNFDELKRGKITFREDGKEAVTLEAHGVGDTGSLQLKSGSESLTMGANQAAIPSWIPAYPNAKPTGTFSMNTKEGTSASFQFQTADAPKDIVAFYERELKHNGFRINASATSDTGGSTSGLVSGDDEANKRTVLVTIGNDQKGTTVGVTYTQK